MILGFVAPPGSLPGYDWPSMVTDSINPWAKTRKGNKPTTKRTKRRCVILSRGIEKAQ